MKLKLTKVFNFFKSKLRLEAEAMRPLLEEAAEVKLSRISAGIAQQAKKKIIATMATDAYTERLGAEFVKIARHTKHTRMIDVVKDLNAANKVCWQLKNGDDSDVKKQVRDFIDGGSYWGYALKSDLIDALVDYKVPGRPPLIGQVKTKEFLAHLFEKDNNQHAAMEMFRSLREDYRRLGMPAEMEKAYLDSERCADIIGENKEQRLFEAAHPGELCDRKKEIAHREKMEFLWSLR